MSVRPEPFGALLYHFGNRKLSFLKDRTLLAIVEALADAPSLDAALDSCAVEPAKRQRYIDAVQTLVTSDIVVPREQQAPLAKESA